MINKGSEFTYEGIHVSQANGIQKYLDLILPKFDRIIEIGTYNGGLTLYIFKHMNKDCELISYDINKSFNKVSKEFNIDFRIGDCFSSEISNDIKNLILDKSKRVLLLCDGGNKNEEFNLFSQYLKKDDVIMLHDFSESDDDFKKIKENINWIYSSESSLDKISNSIIKYNLSKYYYDEFKSVIWGSFIKK